MLKGKNGATISIAVDNDSVTVFVTDHFGKSNAIVLDTDQAFQVKRSLDFAASSLSTRKWKEGEEKWAMNSKKKKKKSKKS